MDSTRPAGTEPSSSVRPARAWLHAAGLIAAGVIAWLLWLGYRQPGFVLDFANLSLC
ncbi:MAG TPA: hypothetical protein PLM09_08290 [Casimicrobiaceae bacterium]|nr:hypothetical protein [Casimicrobiaceae bacterium]